MMNQEAASKKVISLLLYIFSFILLLEWFRPIEQLTDTGYIHLFILFIVISFGLAFFNVNTSLTVFVKVVYIIYSLNHLYLNASFFKFKWFPLFLADVKKNIQFLFSREWDQLSNPFRSLLFYILLWLITYLIHYWLIKLRSMFLFLLMTITYITVLDIFTPYDAKWAIVRTVSTGFILLGMLAFIRLNEQEINVQNRSMMKKWFSVCLSIVLLCIITGFVGPKAGPMWPDPVPFFKSVGQGNEREQASKVGYSMDDSNLGGPFVGDDEVVFTTEIDSKHYWKAETKDVYTGKGWERSHDDKVVFIHQDERIPIVDILDGVETTEQRSSVIMNRDYVHIFYPNGIKYIHTDTSSNGDLSYNVNKSTGKIEPIYNGKAIALSNYDITYHNPSYHVEHLKEVTDVNAADLPQSFIEQYTQLPEGLPQRTTHLAEEITSAESNWFDKAKAVERFFQSGEFFYDQRDVAIPSDRDDYVDQFLFETKKGYCDNFSSSMVVMMRSVGIPSRWVKGFTEGEYKGVSQSGKKLYEITNNNAHSWVEVYFPNVGWVPFEPTKGFSNNAQFNYQLNQHKQEEVEKEQPEQEIEQPKQEKVEKTEKDSTVAPTMLEKWWKSAADFLKNGWKWMVLLLCFMLAVAFVLYFIRGKWLPYYYLVKYKNFHDPEQFEKAYFVLLKELERIGLERKNGDTLREFAKHVDRFFSINEMTCLTLKYEQYVYSGELAVEEIAEVNELWENLIKTMRT
ncbi:transglutaminaseTgpA domain-containing protein [Bacillus aquiflavi]|uniref:transglutaminaseTgpA domain-containing protein n=1 Tax=Bacillus aquiflavi TaxID=2672567 RepID=UPI001CA89839|nr:transglutaminaseTgpA domain-containing protein [Bacillus aquiflavi]UAC48600.1 transglutaminaseTgpA domain-containing protein [Bacillus aquiflavi]